MVRGELRRRLDALEYGDGNPRQGGVVCLVLEPGETSEEGIARYEAKHGPRDPGQPAVIWRPITTGVPRGEGSLCA